ncbi:ycf45 [Scenedesmus sp. PABB004]|nr:ycf45 [Scenedesmus sp. PABB004]
MRTRAGSAAPRGAACGGGRGGAAAAAAPAPPRARVPAPAPAPALASWGWGGPSATCCRRARRGARLAPRAGASGAAAASAAAATAAPASPGAAADAGAAADEAAAAEERQREWEEEIEETLKLVRLLPPSVRGALEGHARLYELLEVVMDLGRPPLARFPGADEPLSDAPVAQADLDYAVEQVGEFGGDNRAGIDATLHRISCLRNRSGRIVGLTCRVGRAIHGSAALVADLVGSGASVLFMGRPGVGKTTAIRELSRLLAEELERRVVVVDTSNEIGGDGDVPHAGIGRARRMQVPDPEVQHRTMIEAVENHMPQVVVIDEIGTEAEAAAARTIAQRGVQLVATAHGNELANLIKNPALCDLVGGIQSVTLGDDEAKRRGVQKSILERAAPPTFDVAVEMLERSRWVVYADVGGAVDALLAGAPPGGQVRERAPDGSILKYRSSGARAPPGDGPAGRVLPELRRPGAAGGAGAPGGEPELDGGGGGFVRGRAFGSEAPDLTPGAGPTLTRRGRAVRLGAESPEGALLRLHVAELDEERLWEVMSAMGLHDKVTHRARVACRGGGVTARTAHARRVWRARRSRSAARAQVYLAPRPAEADAVLAVRSRLKANASLRAASRAAGVPVYAIKSSSSANLVRAFRTLLGLEPSAGGLFGSRGSMDDDEWVPRSPSAAGASPGASADDEGSEGEGDEPLGSSPASPRPRAGGVARALAEEEEGLEEARLAAESIVLPLQQPVELLPRSELVRKAQAEMAGRYGLAAEVVGAGADARLRLLPDKAPRTPPGGGAGSGEEENGASALLERFLAPAPRARPTPGCRASACMAAAGAGALEPSAAEAAAAAVAGVSEEQVQANYEALSAAFLPADVQRLCAAAPGVLALPVSKWLAFFEGYALGSGAAWRALRYRSSELAAADVYRAGAAIAWLKELGPWSNADVAARIIPVHTDVLAAPVDALQGTVDRLVAAGMEREQVVELLWESPGLLARFREEQLPQLVRMVESRRDKYSRGGNFVD